MNFTQYLMPNGRKRAVTIDVDSEIEHMATELEKKGCRFEIEMLMTGQISMTCERGDIDEPVIFGSCIVENGPGMKEAVEQMVKDSLEQSHDTAL